ncbi:hypothetical protein L596_002212 [Steinernema carpocapsae]|uniref:Rhodanese domain-containing protein n=1 Tax=Steinernema carpocapsae TaxID=34508 RepID=A0A4U8UNU9_STECR|nr:hypothetical protein L596_002212 [Steinernema carpocapsae]
MIDKDKGMREIDACMLADWIRNGEKGIVVDCRSFMEYNNCHVKSAVNAFYSKMIRRRLQKKGGCCDFIKKHLAQTIRFQANEKVDLVLYGSGSGDSARQEALSDGGFLHTLYEHLVNSKTDQQFSTVMVLKAQRGARYDFAMPRQKAAFFLAFLSSQRRTFSFFPAA